MITDNTAVDDIVSGILTERISALEGCKQLSTLINSARLENDSAKHLPIVIKAFKEHRKAIQKCVDLIYNKGDTKARQQEADSANQKLLKAIDDASKEKE